MYFIYHSLGSMSRMRDTFYITQNWNYSQIYPIKSSRWPFWTEVSDPEE